VRCLIPADCSCRHGISGRLPCLSSRRPPYYTVNAALDPINFHQVARHTWRAPPQLAVPTGEQGQARDRGAVRPGKNETVSKSTRPDLFRRLVDSPSYAAWRRGRREGRHPANPEHVSSSSFQGPHRVSLQSANRFSTSTSSRASCPGRGQGALMPLPIASMKAIPWSFGSAMISPTLS